MLQKRGDIVADIDGIRGFFVRKRMMRDEVTRTNLNKEIDKKGELKMRSSEWIGYVISPLNRYPEAELRPPSHLTLHPHPPVMR